MRKRDMLIRVIALLAILLVVACKGRAPGNQVTIKCPDCDMVQLWDTSHEGRVVGEVKPGDTGIATGDKVWNPLVGCTYYYIVVGDQEGYVCDDYLEFK